MTLVLSTSSVDVLINALLTVGIILWLYWLWTRRHFYRFMPKLPGYFGLPFLGILTRLNYRAVLDIFPVFDGLFEDYKSYTLGIWTGPQPAILTADPEFIQHVLSSPDLLHKAPQLYRPLYDLCGGGLAASPVSKWQPHRKIANPAFTNKVLVSFFPYFNKAMHLLVSALESKVDNGGHKVLELLKRTSMRITTETILGKGDATGEFISSFTKDISFVNDKTSLRIILSAFKLSWVMRFYIKYQKTMERLHKEILGIFDERLSNAASAVNISRNQTEEVDSIKKSPDIYIDLARKGYEKQIMTREDVKGELFFFIVSSYETSALTIASTLVFLATHPEVQERLFEEVLSIFPGKLFDFEYEHINKLPYMTMVINETLRLAPSIPLISRYAAKDTAIGPDLVLPKGIEIGIPIYNLHRRKDIWGPNADKFDPDNFLPHNIAEKHPYAYIPFSKGMRNCIGWRYSLFTLHALLSGLVRNFIFTTNFKYEDVKYVENIAIKFLNEPDLKLQKRAI